MSKEKQYPQELKDFIELQLEEFDTTALFKHVFHKHPREYKQIINSTLFLGDSKRFVERLYCILHDITEQPVCKYCGIKKVRFRRIDTGYSTFCGGRCVSKEGTSMEKIKQTCFEKYGVASTNSLQWKKDKIKDTMIKKYGADNIFKTEEFKEYNKQYNLEKYGVEYNSQSKEVQEKVKQTNMKNLGVEWPMQSPLVREKAFKSRAEFLKEHPEYLESNKIVPSIGKNETQILNEIEQKENIKIERQYPILGYVVDGYCKETNTVYEVDEVYHLNQKEQDAERQKNIEQHLSCKFIRIKDY